MAATVIPTIVTGDVATAAWGNTYLRDNAAETAWAKAATTGHFIRVTGTRTVEEADPEDGAKLDGDHLDIDFTPSIYTPATTPAEAADVDDLAAHLYGIDQALNTLGNQKIFIPAGAALGFSGATHTALGDFDIWAFADGSTQEIRVSFFVPFTPSAVFVIVSAGGTGNMIWTALTDFGAVGESVTANSDSLNTQTIALTAPNISEVDITNALTGLALGDYVGLRFGREGGSGSDTIGGVVHFLGVRLDP